MVLLEWCDWSMVSCAVWVEEGGQFVFEEGAGGPREEPLFVCLEGGIMESGTPSVWASLNFCPRLLPDAGRRPGHPAENKEGCAGDPQFWPW